MSAGSAHPANKAKTRRSHRLALEGDDSVSASGSDAPAAPSRGRRVADVGRRRAIAAATAAEAPATASRAAASRPPRVAAAVLGRRQDARAGTATHAARRQGAAAREEEEASPAQSRTSKRKREYAWMDSGDEASSADEDGAESETSGARQPAEPARLSEVDTFSQMLRLVPQLRRRLLSMQAAEMVEVVVAAARIRFYDGEFFGELLPEFRARLKKRGGAFTARELVDTTAALQELNAYDAAIFSGVARELKHRAAELDTQQRRRLLAVFKMANHKDDAEFVALLVQRDKQEAEAQQATRQSGDYLVMRSPGQLRPGRM